MKKRVKVMHDSGITAQFFRNIHESENNRVGVNTVRISNREKRGILPICIGEYVARLPYSDKRHRLCHVKARFTLQTYARGIVTEIISVTPTSNNLNHSITKSCADGEIGKRKHLVSMDSVLLIDIDEPPHETTEKDGDQP